jgi:hypothetical protein
MLTATCHCGAVQVEVPRKPRTLTNCNCSICRRYGALWAYYKASEVRVTSAPGVTREYIWGDKSLRFVRCGTCGCVTHWESITPEGGRMGVNARNFEPRTLGSARVRLLDNTSK